MDDMDKASHWAPTTRDIHTRGIKPDGGLMVGRQRSAQACLDIVPMAFWKPKIHLG